MLLIAQLLSVLSVVPHVFILGLGISAYATFERKSFGIFAMAMGALGTLFAGMIVFQIFGQDSGGPFWVNLSLVALPLSLMALAGHAQLLWSYRQSSRFETALKESERQYRTLSELAHDMIFMVDPNDKIIYVNAFAANSLRKSVQEIVGKPLTQLFPPGTAQRMQENLKKVFQTGEAIYLETQILFP